MYQSGIRSTSRARTSSSSNLVESKIEAAAKCRPPAPATGRVRALHVHPLVEQESGSGAHVAAKAHMLDRPRHLLADPAPAACFFSRSRSVSAWCVPPLTPVCGAQSDQLVELVDGMTCVGWEVGQGGGQCVPPLRATPCRRVPHVAAHTSPRTRCALPEPF